MAKDGLGAVQGGGYRADRADRAGREEVRGGGGVIPRDTVRYTLPSPCLAISLRGTGAPTSRRGVGGRGRAELSGGKPFEEFEKEFFTSVRPTSLLKRFATTDEVASLVAYVCSPLASATNGAALRVDGGVVRACF